jgi:glucokinase
MLHSIAVDLGGTNLRVAVVSADGVILEKITTGTKVQTGRDSVIQEMTDTIRSLQAKHAASGPLAGVGIGVPGITDAQTGMLRESPNLPGWSDYPVRDEIERRLGASVFLENDANAAAVGEAWLGAARDVPSMVMITLGTGVGGGIVLDGRALHGMTGMAGELGHITIDPNGHKCNCGNYGCIEQFASATAIVRMARVAAAGGNAPALASACRSTEFSARAIHNLALQGDKPAQAIFEKAGWALGILLADLVNALNLHMYVIGGGAASSWPSFAPAMFAELQRRSFVYAATAPDDIANPAAATASNPAHDASQGVTPTLKPLASSPRTIVTQALLGGDAGLYGAARLPLMAVCDQHPAVIR